MTRGARTGLLVALWATAFTAVCPEDGTAQRRRPGHTQQTGNPKDDWAGAVEKACTSRRYGLRIAAAKRIAKGGESAVPALRAWEAKNGRNAFPLSLVDAFAATGTRGPELLALLRAWAGDRKFFWRAQALRALAARKIEDDRQRFTAAVGDPSWLLRHAGALGLLGLGDPAAARKLLADRDPRLRVWVAADLLQAGHTFGIATLLEALVDARSFLGDPWGSRQGDRALQALRAWAGDDASQVTKADPARALATFKELAEARGLGPFAVRLPSERTDHLVGGIEIRSCRNGDLFLRWSDTGKVVMGLEQDLHGAVSSAAWQKLSPGLDNLAGVASHGSVVCDFLRLRSLAPNVHHKCAPGAVPEAMEEWLRRFATALEDAGEQKLAEALRSRLRQFGPGGIK